MFRSNRKTMRNVALGLTAIISTFLSACHDQAGSRKAFPKSAETRRVTSPNGQFDAVLITDVYGPAAGGGVNSNVYIVRKGSPIYSSQGSEIFSADPMTGGELVWRRDHLLEIHYDIAYIHNFRNLWGLHEVERVGGSGEGDYEIEIKLIPTSDSSALMPDGSFRRVGYH